VGLIYSSAWDCAKASFYFLIETHMFFLDQPSFSVPFPLTGCRRLWVRVLRDVLESRTLAPTVKAAARRSAQDDQWVFSDAWYIGSFLWICHVLEIDAQAFRLTYQELNSRP